MSCMLLYVFDIFHILLSGDSLRDLWNAYMYVCMHESTWRARFPRINATNWPVTIVVSIRIHGPELE